MIADLQLVEVPASAEALRQEVRTFARAYVQQTPPHVRARSWMAFDADFSRMLADKGWLGLTLPEAYGGRGRGHFARFVVAEELLLAGAPVGAHWIADRQSGPLIAKYGTPEQCSFYLPRICRGDAFFCIGMSEPNSGSDLASIGSRAELTASGWRLNGRKIWSTHAPRSHYMIALVRTSGKPADRHGGLSQVIVDLKLPGVTVRPIRDLTGDEHFSEVFFDNVELGPDALIGEEGAGWEQVTAELSFERSGPERIYSSIVLLEDWLEVLRRRHRAGRAADVGELRLLGRMTTQLAVLREMSVAITNQLESGKSPLVQAALVKDLGTEFEQMLPELISDMMGSMEDDPMLDELKLTAAYLCQISPTFSLRGGTREILRGMIARGLGLR